MRPLLFVLLSACLWQAAYCATPGISNTALTQQESMVGLQATRYGLTFENPWSAGHMLTDSASATDIYNKGRQDAKLFYRNSGAFWIPFGATIGSLIAAPVFFLPGAGTGAYFLPGFGASLSKGLTKPKKDNLKNHDIRYRNIALMAPTDRLFQDSLYVAGYRKGARQRKLGKAAAGFGTGMGVTLLLVITLAAAAMGGA